MQLLRGKNLNPRCWNGGSPPSLHQLSLPVVFLRAGDTSLAGSGERGAGAGRAGALGRGHRGVAVP